MRFTPLALIGILPFLLHQPPAAPQAQGAPPASADAQQCAALLSPDFEAIPDAPTRIVSARLVEVRRRRGQEPSGIR